MTSFNAFNRKLKDYYASPGQTTITVDDLTKDTRYNFRVAARDTSDTVSTSSASIPVTTGLPPTPPTTVNVQNLSTASFTLVWDGATDDTVVRSYDVYLNGTKLNSKPITIRRFEVSGLTNNTTYAVTIKARDGIGNISAASTPFSVTTLEQTGQPVPPKSLFVTAITDTSVTIKYDPLGGHVSGSVLSFRVGNAGDFESVDPGNLVSGTNSFTIHGLSTGTAYQFRIDGQIDSQLSEGPILGITTLQNCGGACASPHLIPDPSAPFLITKLNKASAVIRYKLTTAASVSVKVVPQGGGAAVMTPLNNVNRSARVHPQSIAIPANLPAGLYQVTVTATSGGGEAAQTNELHQTLIVDRAAPILSSINVSNIEVIPAGANNPTSMISFTSNESVSTTVQISTAIGNKFVRTFTLFENVRGGVAKSIVWDGTDVRGAAVPDANYIVRVSATDWAGNRTTSAPQPLLVERAAPVIAKVTPVSSESTPVYLDTRPNSKKTVRASFVTSELSKYKVELLDSLGTVVRTLSMPVTFDETLETPGTKTVIWNGTGADGTTKVTEGNYRVLVTMIDRVERQTTAAMFVIADATSPLLTVADGQSQTISGTAGTPIAVNYTGSEAVSVTVTIKQGTKVVRTVERAVARSAVSYPGSFTATWNGRVGNGAGTNAQPGTYTMEIVAIDKTLLVSNKLTFTITLSAVP